MKLRNKKTGEIGWLIVGKGSNHYVVTNNEWKDCGKYKSLAELNEEWEDAPEEPKSYWFINTACKEPIMHVYGEPGEMDKELGNYFETREEAERAYEKLKAWKFGGGE